MKSRFVMATVAAVALACLAEPILAQQPGGQGGQPGQRGQRGAGGFGGGGFGGFGGGAFGGGAFGGGRGSSRLSLLNIPEVQKELELVDEQLTAIQKVRDELQPQRGRGGFGGGQPGQPGGQPGQRGRRGGNNGGDNNNGNNGNNGNGASLATPDRFYVQQEAQQPQQPGQRGQRGQGGPGGGFQLTEEQRAEMEKQRAERLKQEKDKLAEILLPHQLKRLNEIYFQQLGVGIVDDPDGAAELKITAEQKAKIAEVRTANQEAMRTMMQEIFANRGEGGNPGGNPGGGRGGFQMTDEQRKKMDDARKANDEKILAVLTSEQKTKLDEMKGKAFAMPENAGRGRGGPGGAPGAGGAPGRARGGNNGNNNNN